MARAPPTGGSPEADDYYAAHPTPEMQRDMQRRAAEAKKEADKHRAKADKILGNTPKKKLAKGGYASSKPAASAKRYASGGSVDGCAVRGKTRASMKG